MLASGSHLWDPESAPMQQQQTISQLRFLPVEATDLEHLAQLEQDLFEDPWSVEMMRTELNNGMVTAVKALDHADRLLGYYFIQIVAEEAELHNIAVVPHLQGQGFGRYLLLHAMRSCRDSGAGKIHLEVRESNSAARGLYESMDFKIVGKRKQYYYMQAEDAILYSRELNELV